MIELNIDRLRLSIEDAGGQQHRLQPIVRSAVASLGNRLRERGASGLEASVGSLSVPRLALNLDAMTNEQAADAIANACLEVLAMKLGI
jgi:hypothetical protein